MDKTPEEIRAIIANELPEHVRASLDKVPKDVRASIENQVSEGLPAALKFIDNVKVYLAPT